MRRHKSEGVKEALSQAGFQDVQEHQLWEIRKIYDSKEALLKEILARTGRSILHELSDSELQDLAHYISQKLENNRDKIFEQDRWTIWTAVK